MSKLDHIPAKVQRRLTRILALAERGEGGEKETAERMLQKLMADYNITLDDLLKPDTRDYYFRHKPGAQYKQLLVQVMAKVMGDVSIYKSRTKQRNLVIKCDEADALEIRFMYEVYSKALEQYLENSFTAFISANDIFSSEPSDSDNESTMSQEDLAQIRAMMGNIAPTAVNKALEKKE